ncbi:hypothetical protein PISMIDRAFT_689564 [Pisolithus microcarpus 441]|uniref:Uncharacterized protein n=1 Tax=Pisolithus microcarpus 441 TaxID=765257 RepID=A0A0C9YPP0_9AGAM|nr:hypothetical protein PISMIDRAFT_689564 [Pisolithus microcarpus 441]
MFVRELEARLPNPTPVVVCAVNPGLCHTRMLLNPPAKSLTWLSRTPEVGSRTLLNAAIGDEARTMHGRYISSCKVGRESTYISSPEGKEFSRRLWVKHSRLGHPILLSPTPPCRTRRFNCSLKSVAASQKSLESTYAMSDSCTVIHPQGVEAKM